MATRIGLRLAAAGLVVVGAGLLLAAGSVGAAPPPTLGPATEISAPGGGYFNGVSCTDATDCTAVGGDDNGQPIYATETAGVWGLVTEVGILGGGGSFNGVSCTDASDCTAVGIDYRDDQPFYATETAGVWGAPTDVTVVAGGGSFSSVSCTDASDCTAVGGDDNGQPIYATESAGHWGAVTEVTDAYGGFFYGVSCTDATDCTAVGGDDNGQPIYATESAGSWGTPTEVTIPTGDGFFTSVSCTDATDCTAVGYDYDGEPIYATESAGSWDTPTELTDPYGGYFGGVSCTDATDCTAVGYDYNGQPIYATETDGVWGTATEVPAPGGGGYFTSVSCTDAIFCTAVGQDDNYEPVYTADLALVPDGSQVHAVIQVETSPAYAGDHVIISSSQLEASCGGTILFETLQGGLTTAPRRSFDSINVVLDDDGNVTVVVDGNDCAAGSDLVDADLTTAPYLTALTTLIVEPPQVTASGVSAYPNDEVETGNSATSGESDVYAVFYVETSPVYAEQPVTITSPQLQDRCGQGWRWEPGMGSAVDQASGTTVATGTLDNDGNAVFVFKGASCAAGTSTVIADVDAGTRPTYTMTYSVGAPAETLGSTMKVVAATRHHRHHRGPKGAAPGSDAPAMTVTASPNPLVETGEGTPAPPTTCGDCEVG
jgi:hypothetical protein